jgi:hypothetical protein|tara:strand:+ start:2114 stop:2263 length:150 start_codon:yes stop_codon:yes gene_type:complete
MELFLGIISLLTGVVLLGWTTSMPLDHEWYDTALTFGAFFVAIPFLIGR